MSELDQEYDAILQEAADGIWQEVDLEETWSDAARAAALAARRAKSKGQNWRKAARMSVFQNRQLFSKRPFADFLHNPVGSSPSARFRAGTRLRKQTTNVSLDAGAKAVARDRARRAQRFRDMEHAPNRSLFSRIFRR